MSLHQKHGPILKWVLYWYFIPVVQYFAGEAKVIWPDEYKDADIVIPDYAR